MAEGLAGEGGEDRAVLAGRPRVQRRSPAEALQAVLMLLNWQVQLVQDALAMLRASAHGERRKHNEGAARGGGANPPATRRPSDRKKKGVQRN